MFNRSYTLLLIICSVIWKNIEAKNCGKGSIMWLVDNTSFFLNILSND